MVYQLHNPQRMRAYKSQPQKSYHLPHSFMRDDFQEDAKYGGKVYRWFDRKDGSIISVVEGYYPNEANIRVSLKGKDSFEIRGHKDLVLKKSDDDIINIATRGVYKK